MPRSRKFKLIHVYCPAEQSSFVQEILDRHKIHYILNKYDLKNGVPKIVCHFRSADMTAEEQSFLITATEKGAWVEPLISYLDRVLKYTEIEMLDARYFLHQKAFSLLSNVRSQFWKRLIDFSIASVSLVALLPVFALVALAIRIDSRGSVIYRQRRVGLYNEEFEVIKLRSMHTDAEVNGAQWASKEDCRVTRVGKFIRKTRIDELPQLVNVIKGEMSLIGPRPEREVFIQELEKTIPYYRFRHAVKPGITGLAQVKYPYGASVEDAVWKHKYDIYYIKHQSAMMDFKIALLTLKTIFTGSGQ